MQISFDMGLEDATASDVTVTNIHTNWQLHLGF
jgi:hypothetical protein